MTHGSLFAGIKGDKGFDEAGFECKWAVEIEPFCQAVIRTHYAELPIFSDIKRCGAHNLEPVDCITAGVPCQDVSVAGKRQGLQGQRTGLFYDFARILRELRPAWFVFENVPGLLSSNCGRDFAEVLRVLMVECGYGVCWRVLDSQFFGVAQRRRRVFIVGCFGRPCPAEVLFEPESGKGNPEKGAEARPHIAAPLTSGSGVTGNAPGRRREDDENLAYCLREDPGGIGQGHNTTYAVTENMRNRSQGPANYIAFNASDYANGDFEESDQSRPITGTADRTRGAPIVTGPLNTRNGHSIRNRGTFVGASPDSDRVRDFAGLPEGLDSARYRALGNAWTVQVGRWIGRRIVEVDA